MNKEILHYFGLCLKESLKFALVGFVIFMVLGLLSAILLIEVMHIDVVISGIIIGLETALTTLLLDYKKFHYHTKLLEYNHKLSRKIVDTLFKNF